MTGWLQQTVEDDRVFKVAAAAEGKTGDHARARVAVFLVQLFGGTAALSVEDQQRPI
jgi:hypothetical protein